MTTPQSDYNWLDDTALAIGLGLVLLGLVVMGFFETILGSAHFTVGDIIVHTSFTPHLRAYFIALGLLVLLVWGVSRVVRAVVQ